MIVRFLTGRFIWEYSPEEVSYVHQIFLEDDSYVVEILDFDSSIYCGPQGKSCCPMPSADGYLLVCSVNDGNSFEALTNLLPRVPIAAPCLIVANKSDLGKARTFTTNRSVKIQQLWLKTLLRRSFEGRLPPGPVTALGKLASSYAYTLPQSFTDLESILSSGTSLIVTPLPSRTLIPFLQPSSGSAVTSWAGSPTPPPPHLLHPR